MKWFAVLASVVCLVPTTLLLQQRTLEEVQQRVSQLESGTHEDVERIQVVQEEIALVRSELKEIESELRTAPAEELALRLQKAESTLYGLGTTLVAQDRLIGSLRQEFDPAVLEARLLRHNQSQEERWNALQQIASSAADLAGKSLEQVRTLRSEDELEAMWRELVGPVVQLSGETSVGSGVLLESQPTRREGVWRTYLLTAWHVVRDIQDEESHHGASVPVTIYDIDGRTEQSSAALLLYDPGLDVALLQLERDEPVKYGTTLAPRNRIKSVRTFDEIFAVGCPLGNDPIPTHGEVASPSHGVDGESYWMINAPTYIGNSGGAIFDANTHELLGIFSKIYTHGSLRPTVVPHMGLVTPLDVVYDWFQSEGYGYLEPVAPSEEARVSAAR